MVEDYIKSEFYEVQLGSSWSPGLLNTFLVVYCCILQVPCLVAIVGCTCVGSASF